jgi:hypothetical protein
MMIVPRYAVLTAFAAGMLLGTGLVYYIQTLSMLRTAPRVTQVLDHPDLVH